MSQEHQIKIEAQYKDMMTAGVVKSKKNMKGLGDETKKAGKEVETMGKKAKKAASGGMKQLGGLLKSSTVRMIGFAAAAAGLSKSVGIFMDAQKALTEVATISPEVAGSLDEVGEAVKELAIRFGQAEAEVSQGLYQTISAGVTDPIKALELLEVSMGLATGGLAGVTETTDLLVGTMNAFGDEAGSAADVADVMFATVRQGKTTIGELAQSMSIVTPVAAALGVSLQETNAAVATLTLSGAPTSVAVTQVGAALTALLTKSKDVDEALRQAGSSGKGFDLVRLRSEGLVTVLQDLRETYEGNEDALASLLGRKEAQLAVFGLTGEKAEVFTGILDGVTDSADEAKKALDIVATTMSVKVEQAMSGLKVGMGEVGEAFVIALLGEEALGQGIDDGAARAEKIRDMTAQFTDLAEAVAFVVQAMSWYAGLAGDVLDFGDNTGLEMAVEHMDWLTEDMLTNEDSLERTTRLWEGLIAQGEHYIHALEGLGHPTESARAMVDRLIKVQEAGAVSMIDFSDATATSEDSLQALLDGLMAFSGNSFVSDAVRTAAGSDLITDALMGTGGAASEMSEEVRAALDEMESKVVKDGWLSPREKRMLGVLTSAEEMRDGVIAALAEMDAAPDPAPDPEPVTAWALAMERAVAAATQYLALVGDGTLGPGGGTFTFVDPGMPKNLTGPPGLSPPTIGPDPATPPTASGEDPSFFFTPPDQSAFDHAGAMQTDMGEVSQEYEDAQAALQDYKDELQATADAQEAFANQATHMFASGLTNALMDAATGAKELGDALEEFAAQFLLDIAAMILQQTILNALKAASWGFADGGVVEGGVDGGGVALASGGVVEGGLIGYASGGPIVTKPHVALIGEGRHDEAVVPMPGGKEIPVNLRGGGGGAEVTINVTAMDGTDAQRVLVRERDTIRTIVQDAMMTNSGFRGTMQGGRV